ncbi:hypothetical protein PSY47_23750, partial [Shigella flexneri]|nr:hypothetical protein [Shigella flexneri]
VAPEYHPRRFFLHMEQEEARGMVFWHNDGWTIFRELEDGPAVVVPEYHMQEEAPGMVFWHNDGWTIFQFTEGFVRSKLKE